MRLVECVPNVSEGQNINKINAMKEAVSRVSGVALLHADSNSDANRTVFTFAGDISDVANAAYSLFEVILENVNMQCQAGEHVRNGALDVCPFVPVANITEAECIEAARALADRIGQVGVPVYLYGRAANTPSRIELSNLRKGQYEALKNKLCQPEWKPDYGPSDWSDIVSRSGSVQIGVRPFLVAYNVNLETRDIKIARRIARKIRESGYRGKPGEFRHVKADGWLMASYKCAQVTMNLTDFKETPVHLVFERIRELAIALGTRVTGSELIGMIPLEALRLAAKFYSDGSPAADEHTFIKQAIRGLALDALVPFVPRERIFEYRLSAMLK